MLETLCQWNCQMPLFGEREEVSVFPPKSANLCQVITTKLILRACQPTLSAFSIKAVALNSIFMATDKGNSANTWRAFWFAKIKEALHVGAWLSAARPNILCFTWKRALFPSNYSHNESSVLKKREVKVLFPLINRPSRCVCSSRLWSCTATRE